MAHTIANLDFNANAPEWQVGYELQLQPRLRKIEKIWTAVTRAWQGRKMVL